jgi:hypothetical protein
VSAGADLGEEAMGAAELSLVRFTVAGLAGELGELDVNLRFDCLRAGLPCQLERMLGQSACPRGISDPRETLRAGRGARRPARFLHGPLCDRRRALKRLDRSQPVAAHVLGHAEAQPGKGAGERVVALLGERVTRRFIRPRMAGVRYVRSSSATHSM